jgi:dTDP-4-amino-4,6-dideoxygalactose transaminase
MDEIQAAILRTGLPHLEEWNQRRRQLSEFYATLLKDIPEALARPGAQAKAAAKSACHLQVLRVSRRNALRRYLRSKGIGTGVHYPLSHSQQGAFRKCCPIQGSLVAERLSREVISLPLHPFLRKQEAVRVIDLCKAFWNIQ